MEPDDDSITIEWAIAELKHDLFVLLAISVHAVPMGALFFLLVFLIPFMA